MTLADLVDLEAQLARDGDADPAALEARDRALLPGATPPSSRRERKRLLRRWLAALREARPGDLRPGRRVAGVVGALRAVLALAGLALGWGAATAILRYSGEAPVNVWDFLLAFVGVQLLLLALLLASCLFPVAALGTPLFGLFRGLLAWAYPRLARRAGGRGRAELARWEEFWHRLRSRRSLYHRVEPWLLVSLTQSFGVAFNFGALLGCLRLVVFSDLAFAWSTTLVQLDAARFHALVHALAAPFAWLWPDAEPSRALVDATRYSRLEGAYVMSGARRAAHPELVGGWWPFLLAALATYGLLPRVVTLAVSRAGTAWLLRSLPLDDAEVSRVVRRLAQPHVETRGDDAEAPSQARTAPVELGAAAEGAPAQGRCDVVLWRDVPDGPAVRAAVERLVARPVGRVLAAGGREHQEGATEWRAALDGAGELVLVAEAWEAPDKAALRLLRALRAALGSRRHLRVLLLETTGGAPRAPAAADVRVWREGVAPLADPYLAVEPLRDAAAAPPAGRSVP